MLIFILYFSYEGINTFAIKNRAKLRSLRGNHAHTFSYYIVDFEACSILPYFIINLIRFTILVVYGSFYEILIFSFLNKLANGNFLICILPEFSNIASKQEFLVIF